MIEEFLDSDFLETAFQFRLNYFKLNLGRITDNDIRRILYQAAVDKYIYCINSSVVSTFYNAVFDLATRQVPRPQYGVDRTDKKIVFV
ncbi:hypothetical protein KIPE111705_40345 [Kibdelosporangium persicum]